MQLQIVSCFTYHLHIKIGIPILTTLCCALVKCFTASITPLCWHQGSAGQMWTDILGYLPPGPPLFPQEPASLSHFVGQAVSRVVLQSPMSNTSHFCLESWREESIVMGGSDWGVQAG